jgi:GMP synthase-like glutamine amidotransferase
MKPVALLQHDRTQRPGILQAFLSQQAIPSVTFTPDDGGYVPRLAKDFSGIVLLGSQHSVNDALPWIDTEIALVRDAMAADVPVLGHCFGAQLMAKALGATVSRNAWANIGWSRLRVTPGARTLFDASEVVAFNWHYETFGIPAGAQRTLFGAHCLNKGFATGKHMAFQCHFEVTEDIIREWCSHADAELKQVSGPAVQTRHQILAGMRDALPTLHRMGRRVYQRWAAGLVRPVVVGSHHGGW